MGLPKLAVQWAAKRMIFTSQARYAQKTEGFNKGKLLNWIGLPAVAFVLFVLLPTVHPNEIHSINHYYKNPRWEENVGKKE